MYEMLICSKTLNDLFLVFTRQIFELFLRSKKKNSPRILRKFDQMPP